MHIHDVKKGVMADINMIPLIDVALILLIIFMVLTPFLVQSQIGVQLPKSAQGSQVQQENVIHIQIEPGDEITLEGKRIGSARLEKELLLRLSRASKKTVLVQADRSVNIQKVVEVLDIAKKLGVGKLGIGVTPPTGK